MISRERYLKLREMTRRYEAARKKFDPKRYQRGGGYDVKDRTIISAMAGHRDTSNEEKSQIEDFEWRMYPPSRAFGYYDDKMTKITGFMGNLLGRIIWRGSVTRAFGGKRQNITVRGSNNVMYAGVCNLTGGTYCRLRRIKGRGPGVLANPGLALKPHFPYRVAKTGRVGNLAGQAVVYFGTKTYPRLGGMWARVRRMGAGGEAVGEEVLVRPWLLHKLNGPSTLPNRKKRSRRNPRVKDLLSEVRVTMTREDVARFKSRWPASGLPDRAIWFQFSKRNGDLIDLSPGSERFDGAALAALSQDAQKFAGL